MKKSISRILLSGIMVLIVLSLVSSLNVRADEPPDQTIKVQGNAIQTQLQSNNRIMFCFQERTRLTICANVGLELDINCDAMGIGEKDVILEVEGDNDLRMTMTCTREEVQLGLMNGSLHRVRNTSTYRYLEGFCIALKSSGNCIFDCKCDTECKCMCECLCECDPDCICPCECKCNCGSEGSCKCKCDCECKCNSECTCECDCQYNCDPECKCNSECAYNGRFLKARLRIRETNQNRLAQWAYYDNQNKEWITMATTSHEGYLTAETSFLSTWTLLVPEETISAAINTIGITMIIVSVSAIGILTIPVFYLKKRH
jgi:hypothetical protein